MANLYNLEPQPTAKLILHTTAGDLSLELFAKQTPLASRNFLQHCLDGYYNNTIFHRLLPGFIIQGGDPTGSGAGGISAINDGDPFGDEFHSRLKFNRRGLLGMANDGKDNNGSQFFLTLGATPELQGKHTLFGRIEGETIYNLMKMADAELAEGENSERPMYPTKITGAEILVNPFDDMVARVREAPRSLVDSSKKEIKKRKKPAGKNVLSFAAEDGEDSAAPVLKKTRVNPKLVQAVEEAERPVDPAVPKAQLEKKLEPKRQSSIVELDVETTKPPESPTTAIAPHEQAEDDEIGDDDDPQTARNSKRQAALDKTNAEIAALKASMKRNIDARPHERDKPLSALEAMIPASSTRGRKRGKASDERGALDLFKAFKARLEDLPADSTPETNGNGNGREQAHPSANGDSAKPSDPDAADDEAALCDLHFIANCQSCKSWDEDKPDGEANADGDDDPAWMAHSLTFAKDTLGKDLEWKRKMEEIEVIDPREKARAFKEERRKGKDERKKQ